VSPTDTFSLFFLSGNSRLCGWASCSPGRLGFGVVEDEDSEELEGVGGLLDFFFVFLSLLDAEKTFLSWVAIKC
jgi:hypothetical protein